MHQELSTTEDRRPLVETYWTQCLPFYTEAPGAESFEAFIRRVQKFIKRLRSEKRGNIAVFSHEQFILAVRWLLSRESLEISPQTMGEYREYFNQHRLPNGAILHLKVSPEVAAWPYRLITEHVEQLMSP